jgi:hypothetical protein
MDNAKKFFEELIKTDEARTLLADTPTPESDEARVTAYIDIAKKLGIELTEEEVNAYFAASFARSSEELDDEELAQLAGGAGHAECESTYTDREVCWSSDGCDLLYNDYDGYMCKLIDAKPLTEEEKREIAKKKTGGVCGNQMVNHIVNNNF